MESGKGGGQRRGRKEKKEKLKLTIYNEEFRSTPISYDVEISTPLSAVPLCVDVEKGLLEVGSHVLRALVVAG